MKKATLYVSILVSLCSFAVLLFFLIGKQDAQNHYTEAFENYNSGEIEQALSHFEKIPEEHPLYGDVVIAKSLINDSTDELIDLPRNILSRVSPPLLKASVLHLIEASKFETAHEFVDAYPVDSFLQHRHIVK